MDKDPLLHRIDNVLKMMKKISRENLEGNLRRITPLIKRGSVSSVPIATIEKEADAISCTERMISSLNLKEEIARIGTQRGHLVISIWVEPEWLMNRIIKG